MAKTVFIVYAHPEPRSLNGALRDFAVDHLRQQGHRVLQSDLYAMGFDPVASRADFTALPQDERLRYAVHSKIAYQGGTQAPEITAEQEKLVAADAVILQFPLWWFSMPAILKGWVDRVYACGFAYGVGKHGDGRFGDRYGEGNMMGKRALLAITAGAPASHFSDRGINGALADMLYPIQHGILFYTGMDVLEPLMLYQAARSTDDDWPRFRDAYAARLDTLFDEKPIPFRRQNGGHYDRGCVLRPGLGAGHTGTSIHILEDGDPPQSPAMRTATAPLTPERG